MRPLSALVVASLLCARASAAPPSEWKRQASLRVDKEGVVRTELPLDVVSGARPDLSDLRVFDGDGKEVPYLIEREAPSPAEWQRASSFSTQLVGGRSVVAATLTVPRERLIDFVRLESPTPAFLAAATVQFTSPAGPPVVRKPVFRELGGAEGLDIETSKARWGQLRVDVEPAPGSPAPVITGLLARFAPQTAPEVKRLPAAVVEQSSNAKETRVRIKLPASNLWIKSVQLMVTDQLFTRHVDVLYPTYHEGSVQEQAVGAGTIYRVGVPGGQFSERLTFDINAQVPSSDAILRIVNRDSRPLTVSAVFADYTPAQLIFLAKPGQYVAGVANDAASRPDYDLSGLKEKIDRLNLRSAAWSALTENPSYAPREPLPGIEELGPAIDVSDWPYRKRVSIGKPGVQALELDLEALSREGAPYPSLRLVRDGKQIPFITDQASVERSFQPQLRAEKGANKLTNWQLVLPFSRLPVTYLKCAVQNPFFQRNVRVMSQYHDERGDTVAQSLGSAEWTKFLGEGDKELMIPLSHSPEARDLTVAVSEGDNVPLELRSCTAYYATRRMLFKASPGSAVYLYYGRENVSAPVYDLRLEADELIGSPQNPTALGPEERLLAAPWWQATAPTGMGRWFFWGALCAVVATLLLVIAKLLPAPEQRPQAKGS